MLKTKSPNLWFYVLFLILILTIIFFPIDLPYKIKTSGKIIPNQEWIISKGTDGRLLTSFIDNKQGINKSINVNVFERGDAVNFKINSAVESGGSISINDTVASIYSNELEESLVQLKGDLLVERASLLSIRTGEKSSIVKEAEQNISYAKTKVEEQIRIVERNKKLFEADIRSEEDYQISVTTLQLYKTNVFIAEEQFATVTSGAKVEEIKFIETKIIALEEQINILHRKLAAYSFISPISGVVNRSFSKDTLLMVSDTSEYVLVIPILYEEIEHISTNQDVELNLFVGSNPIKGKILSVGNKAYQVGGNQIIIVIASIHDNTQNLLPGLFVKCQIYCNEISMLEYIKNWFIRLLA